MHQQRSMEQYASEIWRDASSYFSICEFKLNSYERRVTAALIAIEMERRGVITRSLELFLLNILSAFGFGDFDISFSRAQFKLSTLRLASNENYDLKFVLNQINKNKCTSIDFAFEIVEYEKSNCSGFKRPTICIAANYNGHKSLKSENFAYLKIFQLVYERVVNIS